MVYLFGDCGPKTKTLKPAGNREDRQPESVGGPALRAHSRKEAVPPASLEPLQRQLPAGQRMLGVQGRRVGTRLWFGYGVQSSKVHERKLSLQCGNDDGETFKRQD